MNTYPMMCKWMRRPTAPATISTCLSLFLYVSIYVIAGGATKSSLFQALHENKKKTICKMGIIFFVHVRMFCVCWCRCSSNPKVYFIFLISQLRRPDEKRAKKGHFSHHTITATTHFLGGDDEPHGISRMSTTTTKTNTWRLNYWYLA